MSAEELARPLVRRCAWPYPQSRRRIDRACDDRTPSGGSECAAHCSFRLLLVENCRDQVWRHRLEMGRLHRITRSAFRKRTNRSRVTKQFGQRNLRVNDRQITPRLYAVDAAATPAKIVANVPLKFLWRDVFNFHDRLEQNRFALLKAVLHRKDRRQFERQLAGIDFVETSVNDVHLNIDNGITAKDAVEHCFLDALLDRWNVFAGNDAADDLVLDDQTFSAIARAYVYLNVSVLTAPAWLFDQFADAVRIGSNRFAVRDLGFARVCIHFELAEHAVPDDF